MTGEPTTGEADDGAATTMTGRTSLTEPGALARLVSRGVGATTSTVREMHAAIAGRAFTASGPLAAPVQAVHDAIAGLVYASVGGVSAAVGAVAGTALDGYPWPHEGRVVSRTKAGSFALSALNGVLGDRLNEERSALDLAMTVRADGRDVQPVPAELTRAYPGATGKLAVFVHGLCENEQAWWWSAQKRHGDAQVTYGSLLARDFDYTPVYLRYNTGLHVSENGRQLAELLDQVVAAWPGEVAEIALIGHSMGGLVARSAGHVATTTGLSWPGLVRHCVSLATPHLGAPLEKATNVASWALAAFPETRPVATALNVRSSGIKDLRYGYLCDEDWTGYDGDEPLRCRRSDVPLLVGAAHHFVGVTLTDDPGHPVGRLLGDLMVLLPSASGLERGVQRIPFEVDNGRHFGRMNHLSLLNHPEVYEQLAAWLRLSSPSSAAITRSEGSVLPPQTRTATCSPEDGT